MYNDSIEWLVAVAVAMAMLNVKFDSIIIGHKNQYQQYLIFNFFYL